MLRSHAAINQQHALRPGTRWVREAPQQPTAENTMSQFLMEQIIEIQYIE